MLIYKEKNDEPRMDFSDYMRKYIPGGLRPNRQQMSLIERMDSEDYVIVKQSRQCGTSKLIAARIAYTIYKNTMPNLHIMVMSPTMQSTRPLFEDIHSILNMEPGQYTVVKDTREMLTVVKKGCTMTVECISEPNRLNGKEFNELYIDNGAFFLRSEADRMYENVCRCRYFIPRVKITVVSIPNGKDGFFNRLWDDAVAGRMFKPFSMHWFMNEWQSDSLEWRKPCPGSPFGEDVIQSYGPVTPDMAIEMLLGGYTPSSEWTRKMEGCLSEGQYNREVLGKFD